MLKRKFELPDKPAFTIETDEDFPKLHTMLVASGKRGGGKSVAVANFLKEARDRGYYDRVWVITPTYHSNRKIWDICYVNRRRPEDLDFAQVHKLGMCPDTIEPTPGAIGEVRGRINSERAEWDKFCKAKRAYESYMEQVGNMGETDEDPPWELVRMYAQYNFFADGPPKWKYDHERPPRLALVIDDCLGTALFSSPKEGLVNLCIKHRHEGKGLGISVFILTQSYTSQGGLPRPIRENCTLLLLFEQTDESQRKKEFSEIGVRGLTEERFYEMLDECTSEPFGFLTVDFNPKDESRRFMKNFDTYLNPHAAGAHAHLGASDEQTSEQ